MTGGAHVSPTQLIMLTATGKSAAGNLVEGPVSRALTFRLHSVNTRRPSPAYLHVSHDTSPITVVADQRAADPTLSSCPTAVALPPSAVV